VLATLPDVGVSAGALVVVHLVPDTELKPFYQDAVNVRGGDSDIPFSNVVLAIRDASGKVTSAVPFSRSDLPGDPDVLPAAFPGPARARVGAALGPPPTPVDGAAAGPAADPATADGTSVRRLAGHDHHEVDDWTHATAAPFNSYGNANP